MNTIKKLLIGAALVAVPFSSAALNVHAVDLTTNLENVNKTAQLGGNDPVDTIGRLIQTFLGVLGIVFLLLIIYAGFQWMTAAGDEKKVASAKGILMSAIVGLVIILAAYAISSFVITQLTSAIG